MNLEARPDQDHHQGRGEQRVCRRHQVVGVAMVEVGQRRDEERVVGRVKVGKNDKSRGVRSRDLQLNLPLHRDVIDGGATVRDVELRSGVEVEEVRTSQVAANKREPVNDPEGKRADAGTRRGGVPEPDQAAGETRVHRPLSSRRAKRSGSLAFLIARCAPLMS